MNKALGFLALIFIIGGLGLGIVALATNNWAENGDLTHGFFQTCRKYPSIVGVLCSHNLDDDHRDTYKDDEWYLGSVGSHSGGVLFGFIGMVLWFAALCSRNSGIRGAAIIFVILSFAGFMIGVIVWKFKYIEDKRDTRFMGWDEGYSFWLAVGAVASTGVAAILTIASAVSHSREK